MRETFHLQNIYKYEWRKVKCVYIKAKFLSNFTRMTMSMYILTAEYLSNDDDDIQKNLILNFTLFFFIYNSKRYFLIKTYDII